MHLMDANKVHGEKLIWTYARTLRNILNESWKQHPMKRQLYCHLLPISKNVQIRRIRHARHCWRSKEDLISDILLFDTLHMDVSVLADQLTTYLHKLCCADTWWSLEDLRVAMDNRDGWGERERESEREREDYPWCQSNLMIMICLLN